jgi:hypothetical protein
MKAKLIKQNGIGIQTIDGADYYLILDGKTYHTNPLTSDLSNGGKLSKQNCDEIFGVVDVEKLANYEYPEGDDWSPEESLVRKLAFLNGFNKSMELNKDKLFTLEDMHEALHLMNNTSKIEISGEALDIIKKITEVRESIIDKILDSKQPTEIEVEIEMVFLGFEMESGLKMEEPKLDSNGNLILRKL